MRLVRAAAAAILLGIAVPLPAQATTYAYWSYWQGDSGAWKYATVGAGVSPAVDGAVDGWRFTIATPGHADAPSSRPDFASICGSTTRPNGAVRVAIVIDDGADHVRSACAVVADGLSRASALAAVAALRSNSGFICAIDGYPQHGCGDAVPDASPSPSAPASTSATSTPRTSATQTPSAPGATSTSTAPSPSASATTTSPATPHPTAAQGEASATAAPTATASASAPQSDAAADGGSPLPTIVTTLLAGVALALALRNARRQRGERP